MKKHIYYPYSLVLFVLITGITGCSDFLDREPLGRYTENDIPAGSFDSQVFGVYSKMRAFGVSAMPYMAVHNFRSDDADKGSSLTDGAAFELFYDNFQYRPDEGWLLSSYWADHYALIIAANAVISDIDSVKISDDATLINKGEAKFMRAYAYFNLVRAFGDIPKIDFKVYNAAQANIAKSPSSEIFTLIDADLQEAAATLPVTWESKYIGRLTRGAAIALQAKSYMWRANWAGALASSKQLIGSGYSLSNDFSSIFRETGENNAESIFEIQAYYSSTITNLGIEYAQQQGIRGSGSMDLGWGWNTPNQSLADAFEAGDPRKDATLLYAGQINTPYNEDIPAATANLPRKYWNKKVYTNPAIREANASRFGQWMNLRIIRYADVLLWAAEAANELGNTTEALGYLEQVRGRARGSNAAVLPKVTTTDKIKLRDAIRHERRVELGMENERFFDIVRWGIAEEVMHAAGKTGYQPKHRYLPIPQAEIDRSGGKLIQNPDYK